MDGKSAGLSARALRGRNPRRPAENKPVFIDMNDKKSKKRHRINVDAAPGFETKVRLLAAKWGVKTNVAIQRAVELAVARKWSEDEKTLLKTVAVRTEEILRLLLPE